MPVQRGLTGQVIIGDEKISYPTKRRRVDYHNNVSNNGNFSYNRYSNFSNNYSKPNFFQQGPQGMSSTGLDPCWICGSSSHRRRDCDQKLANDGYQRKLVCLGCRKRGHVLSECPDHSKSAEQQLKGGFSRLCYNCGSLEHSVHQCTEDKIGSGMTFASCFICSNKGHLSKDCPTNRHGVYPRGGCCKLCGQVSHLADHCPTLVNKNSVKDQVEQTGNEKSDESEMKNTNQNNGTRDVIIDIGRKSTDKAKKNQIIDENKNSSSTKIVSQIANTIKENTTMSLKEETSNNITISTNPLPSKRMKKSEGGDDLDDAQQFGIDLLTVGEKEAINTKVKKSTTGSSGFGFNRRKFTNARKSKY
jgi:Zinc knuckle